MFELLAGELERFRTLQGFASHDLRGEIGRALSSLRLLESPELSAQDRSDLTEISLSALKQALDSLDATLEKTDCQFYHCWMVDLTSSQGPRDPEIRVPVLLRHLATNHDFQEQRKRFRADAIVLRFDAQIASTRVVEILEQMGSSLTKYLLLGGGDHPDLMRLSSDLKAEFIKVDADAADTEIQDLVWTWLGQTCR